MGLSQKDIDEMRKTVEKGGSRRTAPVFEVVIPVMTVKAIGKTEPRERPMNKTEAKYAVRLEAMRSQGRILRYRFEAVKLRLADRTYLTMDFMVQLPGGLIEFHDVKAYWKKAGRVGIEEDANVKMKVAAEQYPEWTFKAVWEKGGDWQEKVF